MGRRERRKPCAGSAGFDQTETPDGVTTCFDWRLWRRVVLFSHCLAPVATAEADVGFIAADLDLVAFGQDLAVVILAHDHGRLLAAPADGTHFAHFIGQSQKGGAVHLGLWEAAHGSSAKQGEQIIAQPMIIALLAIGMFASEQDMRRIRTSDQWVVTLSCSDCARTVPRSR